MDTQSTMELSTGKQTVTILWSRSGPGQVWQWSTTDIDVPEQVERSGRHVYHWEAPGKIDIRMYLASIGYASYQTIIHYDRYTPGGPEYYSNLYGKIG